MKMTSNLLWLYQSSEGSRVDNLTSKGHLDYATEFAYKSTALFSLLP